MNDFDFRSPLKKKRDAKKRALYNEYLQLCSEGKPKMMIQKYLCDKYSMCIGTYYQVIKEKRNGSER